MSQFNGAYYGPPMPPPSRSSAGSACNPLACCCCCKCIFNCVASCVLQILCTLLIIAAIIGLIIYLILKPNKVNFTVTDAAVTIFDYQTTTSTLNYEVALNVTVENKNKRLGISYETIFEASAFYEKQKFSSITMMPFFQKVKNTSLIHPVFRGQNKVALGGQEVYHYFKDRNEAMYQIDVKLYLKVKFRWIWFVQTSKFSPVIDCDVKAPVYSHGKAPVPFQPKECGFDW